MFAEVESYLHRLRRRLSRSEWAIRHLGLTPSEGTSEAPGLLIIQIDGFARTQLERAIAKGHMPFLRRLQKRDGYRLHTFYPGFPSTTPAVQAELYYGVRSAVPAFSFLHRKKNKVGMMFDPEWAKDFEAEYQAAGNRGLLEGGSSWSNIYTGGAAQTESHFCAASIGLGDMWRTGKVRNIFLFILLQFPAVLRLAWQLILKTGTALWDAAKGVMQGEKLGLEFMMAISRIFIGTGLRELITIGAKVDLARGLPVVHVNFLAYDEQSHRRGPGSRFAFWALRPIDRAIKQLYHEAQRSIRRDYAVWIFSDHGQESTQSFALSERGGIDAIVQRCLKQAELRDEAWLPRSQRRMSPSWYTRSTTVQAAVTRTTSAGQMAEKDAVTVVAVGPVGHVYFATPLDDEQRIALAKRLVKDGRVPGVLVRDRNKVITWFHARGEARVPDDVPALLEAHPESMRREIANDMVTYFDNIHAGDLVLFGWSPWDKPWTFAPERGAHGGPGPEETQGFALLPPRTRLPSGTNAFIRPSALRAAALHFLGREMLTFPAIEAAATKFQFRLMTYNVHGCCGMDGRISPRRVAHVIEEQEPDIVALQEIDLGRRRSRAEDQAAIIAKELGYHLVFSPTVTAGEEHYGHALLSRWPVDVVKRARLPGAKGAWKREPRVALWARVWVAGKSLHVITTHLGLGVQERFEQMQMLMSGDWIGAIPRGEPVIICGDFNLLPGSAPYSLAMRFMRDAQRALPGHKSLPTFTSAQPFMRIDHILLSPELEARRIVVPRNHLTRVASDHLPLWADLQAVSSDSATTASTPP